MCHVWRKNKTSPNNKVKKPTQETPITSLTIAGLCWFSQLIIICAAKYREENCLALLFVLTTSVLSRENSSSPLCFCQRSHYVLYFSLTLLSVMRNTIKKKKILQTWWHIGETKCLRWRLSGTKWHHNVCLPVKQTLWCHLVPERWYNSNSLNLHLNFGTAPSQDHAWSGQNDKPGGTIFDRRDTY